MDIQFGDPQQLNWLWLLPWCAGAALYGLLATARASRSFATADMLRHAVPVASVRRPIGSTLLVGMAITMMTIALVDIRWGKIWREVPQKGIEVMFVLDVSRSMLAEDTTPNRLERAKQQIKDVVDEMAGDRVGLVVFAGDVRQRIPLTSHYDDFKQSLEEVGPHSVRRGGSRLGDAITTASRGFLSKTTDHKAMIIFTDGEDQESEPLKAAKSAYTENAVRIFTVGLGDMSQGARIPIAADDSSNRTGPYLQHDGQQVWSKLNGQILREIATSTEGAYIPAGTKRVNMSDVYHGYIANVEQQEFETARINSYEARFQWFLALALLFLLLEIGWKTSLRRRPLQARSIGEGSTQEVEGAPSGDEQRGVAA